MHLKTAALKTERQWRSSTGLTAVQFNTLLDQFELSYERIYGKTISERTADCPNQPTLGQCKDLLFFYLIQACHTICWALYRAGMVLMPNGTKP